MGVVLLMGILLSCSSDGEDYPSLISDFACIATDGTGSLHTLLMDDGTTYTLSNSSDYNHYNWRGDSTYRVVCRYLPDEEHAGVAKLLAVAQTVSRYATYIDKVDTLKRDAADVQSIWRSGNYINLILNIKAMDKQHFLDFIEVTSPTDRHVAIVLYHDSNGDIQGYTQQAYCSLPLAKYQGQLQEGDTISISIATATGEKKYDFRY